MPDAASRGSADYTRHFEGLELWLAVVGVVVASAALALPRASEPDVLPLPLPDARRLSAERELDVARVKSARENGLSFDVRAVGDALRRLGTATYERSPSAGLVLEDLRIYTERALKAGPEPLLSLRAVQSDLFASAVARFAAAQQPDTELIALGGDFVEHGKANGWLTPGSALSREESAVLFRVRWNELTGLDRVAPFAIGLDEFRSYYSVLLARSAADESSARTALAYVERIARRDLEYPADFARGVVFFRAHEYGASAAAFQRHLTTNPDGPWTLRARNHLLAALAQAPASNAE